MSKKYVVKLTAEERVELETLVQQGKAAGWKIQRAQALLKCDQSTDGPGWPDPRIAEAFGCTVRSLENWRKQAVERGPTSLLERKPLSPRVGKFDGENQARLTKLACSPAPAGRSRWSLRLLAERVVELEIVEAASHETIRRALKKRPPAVAKADVVHSARTRRRLRLPHGASLGSVSSALRPASSRGLHG